MDPIAEKLAAMRFPYSEADLNALSELKAEVARVGRLGDPRGIATYSEIAEGVTFRLPNVNRGEPFQLGFGGWSDLDRAIIGDFLGRIAADSYAEGQFFASALVVQKETRQPSEGLRTLMRNAGALRSNKQDDFIVAWMQEVQKAWAWYANH